MKKTEFRRFLRLNFFTVFGLAVGLVTAVLLLTIGFWRTLLILILMGGGAAVGIWLDRGKKLEAVVESILPETEKNDKEESEEDF